MSFFKSIGTKKEKEEKSVKTEFNSNLPSLEFVGNREVIIEGSKGVLLYSQEKIRINTISMVLEFSGRNLNLKCISDSALIIDGFIFDVSFCV